MNFIKSFKIVDVYRQSIRQYAFKSDLKIKWVRPEKIPCIKPEKSGDVGTLKPFDKNEVLYEFRNSQELKTAEENVRSLFLLENHPRIETSNAYRETYVTEVQRHRLDYGSMESKLATMTATIRRFQEHMEKFPRDVYIKIKLKEMIEKRKKFLKYLRRWDYKRFEWILEKLDLVYKPPPTEFHWITRKESLCKLTNIHCENIKSERLNKYRETLESQQIPFLNKKIEKLEFIRKEQQECKVPVTVSQEEIDSTRKKLAELQNARKKNSENSEQI